MSPELSSMAFLSVEHKATHKIAINSKRITTEGHGAIVFGNFENYWQTGSCVELWPAEWVVAVAAGPGDKYSPYCQVLAITTFYLTLTVGFTHLCGFNCLLYIVICIGPLPNTPSQTLATPNLYS